MQVGISYTPGDRRWELGGKEDWYTPSHSKPGTSEWQEVAAVLCTGSMTSILESWIPQLNS